MVKKKRGAEARAERRRRADTTARLHELVEGAKEGAARGDRDTLQKLSSLLRDEEALAEQDQENREYFVKKAVAGLTLGQKHLGQGEYQALAAALAYSVVVDDSIDILARAAREGKSSAIKVLRTALNSNTEVSIAAAEAMARARSHLVDNDYIGIAWHGLRATGASAAKGLIIESIRDGKKAAVEALRNTLIAEDDGSDPLLYQAQLVAARMLVERPELIGPEELAALTPMALRGADADRAKVFEVIAVAASSPRPLKGSAKAFAEVMATIPPKSTLDTSSALREVSRRYAIAAFDAAAANPEDQELLAPYALELARDEATARASMELLHDMALDGEQVAIVALAQATGRLTSFFPRAASIAAMRILDNTAEDEELAPRVVSALLDVQEAKGQNDDERCLETLGITARYLKRRDPLLKKVRAALRRGLKMYHPLRTRGHSSALRGLNAIADHLRTEDINALLDNLSREAGLIIGRAASHISQEDREQLLETLQKRLKRKINTEGVLAALGGVEKELSKKDLKTLGEKTQVIATKPKTTKPKTTKPTKASKVPSNLRDILQRTAKGDLK